MVNVKNDSAQRLVFCMALAISAGLLWAADVRAAVINGITWLEVDNTNTTVASGSIETNGFDGGGGDQTDDNWDYTTPFGVIGPGGSDERTTSNGTGMLANNFFEDPGNLTTTYIGLLNPGTKYTIFVAFRTASASNLEGVEVSLDSTNWVANGELGLDANLDGDVNDPGDSAGTTLLGKDNGGTGNEYRYVTAGIGTVTGLSALIVYFPEPTGTAINNPVDEADEDEWRWSIIDTVGYRAIPEPASVVLLGLGGIAMLAGRRRRH